MARLVQLSIRSHSFLSLTVALIVTALLLGWLDIPIVSSEGMIIRSHFVAGEIPAAPDDPAWEKIPPMTLPLSGQVITRPVWPEPTARALIVRSVHNGTDAAFYLEWQDNTKNDRLTPGTFRDGAALGLPLGDAPAFFCMGQLDHYITSGIGRRTGRATLTVGRLERQKGKARAKGCVASRSFPDVCHRSRIWSGAASVP